MLRDYLEPSVEMLIFAEDEIILTESSEPIEKGDNIIEGGIEDL